jgi:hypothetical protein
MRGSEVGTRLHLTDRRGGQVEVNDGHDRNQEGGDACKGVNLPKGQEEISRIQSGAHFWGRRECCGKVLVYTDPYRPPVAYTSLDDVPLVVKSSEELPSGVMDSHKSSRVTK